jgi:type IV secretory pathway VirD2 relaxase
MSRDDDFRVRPGRIRQSKSPRARTFIAQALRAAERAGGVHPRSGRRTTTSTFGRGRAASLAADRRLTARGRGAMVKARVVRHGPKRAPLGAHLAYLQRDGVTRDGSPGRMFDATSDDADPKAFAERCEGDRHHFRFIVSPDDAAELADLRTYTRDLMDQASRDLGTRLEWVAVDHWNTEHPHVHVIVRGHDETGQDLVIARDYISTGLRARAAHLVTMELGPRSDVEVRRALDSQVDQERWTRLDQAISRNAAANGGVIDLRRQTGAVRDDVSTAKLGRLRTLERLGIATPAGVSQWHLAEDAEPRLRTLGERGDIIKRMHRELTGRGWERGAESYVFGGEFGAGPVIGRLVARGLDDELKGSAFAIVDGADGRAHHLRFPDLDATGDARPGAIVELRRFEDAAGRARVALAVRSDLPIEAQVTADGATWLDRRLLDRQSLPLASGGFGAVVAEALETRSEHLVSQGLAQRQGQRVVFARDLLDTLRQRELDATSTRLSAETGLPHHSTSEGDPVQGIYRRRLDLASGRFAMIDNGLGFELVPWKPSLERDLARQVSGVMLPGGGIDLAAGRKRGLAV